MSKVTQSKLLSFRDDPNKRRSPEFTCDELNPYPRKGMVLEHDIIGIMLLIAPAQISTHVLYSSPLQYRHDIRLHILCKGIVKDIVITPDGWANHVWEITL